MSPDFCHELAGHAQFQSRQALSDNGPNYPAWIDHQALKLATKPEQITSIADLNW
ncbi:MAG: hypothetical protein GY802_25590 [Gammaproteobacteria bacterium]|nr:hypothetical protein [Gammaproteobacteria bacterium]